MDPEDIVRSLAATNPVMRDDRAAAGEACALCDGPDGPVGAIHNVPTHSAHCPWRLAVEWVSEHPEGPNDLLDKMISFEEANRRGWYAPFNPQYDLIGDAEQAQGPDV